MSAPAVEVAGLGYTYPGGRRALDGVSFSVREGEVFGLLGPNGSGKTTLFRILATLFPVQSGTARLFGKDLLTARSRIGVVFQNPSLDKRLTVRENLVHQGHLYGLRGAELASRVETGLKRVGLLDRAQELAGTLSGGLQRRAELAKGLLHRPGLLILDEPSTGLDPGARKDLWTHLKELRDAEKTTILVTTHWMEEAERCDRLAILSRGAVVAEGTPAELKAAIGGDVVSIEAADPEGLAGRIKERLKLEAQVVDGTVRIEKEDAHRLVPQLAEAFPGEILSARLGRPTLEDVFIRRTGHKFWSEEAGREPFSTRPVSERRGEAAEGREEAPR